nr:hypothetical protein Iba_chr07aCG0060 [Ipomoea batatas]
MVLAGSSKDDGVNIPAVGLDPIDAVSVELLTECLLFPEIAPQIREALPRQKPVGELLQSGDAELVEKTRLAGVSLATGPGRVESGPNDVGPRLNENEGSEQSGDNWVMNDAIAAQFVQDVVVEAAEGLIEKIAGEVMNEEDMPNETSQSELPSVGFEEWAERVKVNLEEKSEILFFEEAKQEVALFFEKAYAKMGQEEYNGPAGDDLLHEAVGMLVKKLASIGLRLKDGEGIEVELLEPSNSQEKANKINGPEVSRRPRSGLGGPAPKAAEGVNIGEGMEENGGALPEAEVGDAIGAAVVDEAANSVRREEGEKEVIEEGTQDTGERVEGDEVALNNVVLHKNKSMPAVCGNGPMKEVETAVIKGPINTNQGSKQCVECDENGEAEKEEEGANENDKQGDSCSNDDGSEDESTQSVSYGTWAKKLKEKAGEDSVLLEVVEEARQEVENFFENALRDLGKEEYDEKTDELVKKANMVFVNKLMREGKEIGNRLKRDLGLMIRSASAAKNKDVQESEASSKKKERVIKNSNDWVGVVEEFMGQDKGFESKVKEALKDVNEYLWTVFDKEKNAYLEEKKVRAMRAAAIFLDIVKNSHVWGAENDLLGQILKANRELIGGRICFWAEREPKVESTQSDLIFDAEQTC